MTIRTCHPGDAPAVAAYLGNIPERERAFYKTEGTDTELAQAWATSGDPLRLLDITEDGVIRGMISIRRGRGQSAHTGEITLLVDPEFRRQSVATGLVRSVIGEAMKAELSHIYVEVTAEHTATLTMFRSLGFEGEALLQGFIKDEQGQLRDLIMMTNRIEENWAAAQLLGIDAGDEL